MSGFDWKLPEPIREEKEMEKTEMMRAAGDPSHPRHKEALEKAKENRQKNIEFWKKRRERYYTNKGSAKNNILDKYK